MCFYNFKQEMGKNTKNENKLKIFYLCNIFPDLILDKKYHLFKYLYFLNGLRYRTCNFNLNVLQNKCIDMFCKVSFYYYFVHYVREYTNIYSYGL